MLTTDGDFYLHTQPGKHYAEGEGCEEARGEEAEEGCKEARCQEAEEGCEEARGQEAEGEEAQGGEEVSDEQRARLFRSLLCSSLNIHKKHNKKKPQTGVILTPPTQSNYLLLLEWQAETCV